jgi:hypothetical protein
MFAYRYCQTTGSRYIHLFNNVRLYSLGYFAYISLIAAFVLVPLRIVEMPTSEAKLAFREDPTISKLIEQEPLVFAFDVSFYSEL